jgi:CheY-like chemotaxis protein
VVSQLPGVQAQGLTLTLIDQFPRVTVCADRESLEWAYHRSLDKRGAAAIVLDLVMDGMDGFEFVRRLRMEVGGRMPVSIWSGKTLTAEDWLLRSANKIVPKGDGAAEEILEKLQALLSTSPPTTGGS